MKIIVEISPDRTVHWDFSTEMGAMILQSFLAEFGPAEEGA